LKRGRTAIALLLFALATLLGIAIGYRRGGSVRQLADLPWGLLLIALTAEALQVMMFSSSVSGSLRVGILLTSYAIVGIGLLVLASFATLPKLGTLFIALGWALNSLVIAANGAMPVSADALEQAGRGRILEGRMLKHELLSDETRFHFLGDVIPLRPPVSLVFSIGDIVFLVGIAVFIAQAMKPARPRSPVLAAGNATRV
jgi:hypothetical protein